LLGLFFDCSHLIKVTNRKVYKISFLEIYMEINNIAKYRKKIDQTRNELSRYDFTLDYALKNKERIPDNINKYLKVIDSTEYLIRNNTSSVLENFREIEEKVKKLEAIIQRTLLDDSKELVNF